MNIQLAYLAAAPEQAPALSVNGAGIGVGVVVIIAAGGGVWYLLKHKKVHIKHGAPFLILGLSLAGTQIGAMLHQMTDTVGQTIAQFISQT